MLKRRSRQAGTSAVPNPYFISYDGITMQLFRRVPVALASYVLSLLVGGTVGIFAAAYVLFQSDNLGIPLVMDFVLAVFAFSFIFISSYVLGYLTFGEILQRRYSRVPASMSYEVLSNFSRAFGMTLILSLTFIVLVMMSSRQRKTGMAELAQTTTSLGGLATASVYLLYAQLNLAALAFSGRRLFRNLSEARQPLWQDRHELLSIEMNAGSSLGAPAVLALCYGILPEQYQIIPLSQAAGIILFILVLWLLWTVLVRQTAVMAYYLRKHQPAYYQAIFGK